MDQKKKVVGHDLREIRTKYQVPSMWGTIYPQWDLLKQYLEAWGPGYYTAEEREEWLFTNRSNKPGDDMKEEVREDEADEAWQLLDCRMEPYCAATTARPCTSLS